MQYAGLGYIDPATKRSLDLMFGFSVDGEPVPLPDHKDKDCDIFHAFGAEPGLKRFRYKFDLIGSNDLTCIMTFQPDGDQCTVIQEWINKTDHDHTVAMEMTGAIPTMLKPLPQLKLKTDEIWINADDYTDISTWRYRYDDGYRNMIRVERDAVAGTALSRNWAGTEGTVITWIIDLETEMPEAAIGFRYCKAGKDALSYIAKVNSIQQQIVFPQGDSWQTCYIQVGNLAAGKHTISLSVYPNANAKKRRNLYGDLQTEIALDGFIITSHERNDYWCQPEPEQHTVPTVFSQENAAKIENSCGPAPLYIDVQGIDVGFDRQPELYAAAFDNRLQRADITGVMHAAAIPVPANQKVTSVIRTCIHHAPDTSSTVTATSPVMADIPQRFEFGYRLLSSNCLMNISYPVYLDGEPIATYTPGKQWGGLYSWDAGMHGIGLTSVDINAAIEILNVYLCGEKDDREFIWHGTPLPIQVYLLNAIWEKTRDKDVLALFYPRLKRLYNFLLGHDEKSPTMRLGTGLINTYPIFYNTGGWDDLPPQVEVHQQQAMDDLTATVSTAHAVRFAKLMLRFARELGIDDTDLYTNDIHAGMEALEKTWDTDEQIYSYVYNDFSILKHESGVNYNHTLDGISPLVTGQLQPEREAVLLQRLAAPGRYWSHVGISSVDQSAPYYDPDGYWNGSVWIPHQWFLWKAVLDAGDTHLAHMIPRTVAETWERICQTTHRSSELFKIHTGEGKGCPHFAGLSGPVLDLIDAIACTGTLTTGFDSEYKDVVLDGNQLVCSMRTDAPEKPGLVLAVMPEPRISYRVIADTVVTCEADDMGLIMFSVPAVAEWTEVRIAPSKDIE